MKECTIIITNNSNKKKILRQLSKNKQLENIKFYSFLELKKKLFFDYDNRTLEYIMKHYNVNLSVAKIYVDNMYFLKDIKEEKVEFLNKLKNELDSEGLLIKCPDFKSYIQNKKVVVYGVLELSLEEKKILEELGVAYELQVSEDKKYKPILYKAKTMEEEVEFVAIKISEYLHKGVHLNNIKVIINEEYKKIIKRIFGLYNIPIDIQEKNLFYSTFVAKEFLNNYDLCSIEDNIASLSNYGNINDLITIINKSVMVKDTSIRKEFIVHDLKNTYVEDIKYDKSVEIKNDIDAFLDQDYVFVLGFNINYYPVVYQDDDYFSDEIKLELGLDTSVDKNMREKRIIEYKLSNIKNLIITYKLQGPRGVYYPSMLINEMNLEEIPVVINRIKSYSKINSEIMYAKDLDNLYKFNIVSENLGLFRNNLYIDYLEYDNSFKGINKEKLHNRLNHELNLSYTSLEEYNECAFKYFVDRILNINIYEENFKTIIGSIMHHVLELGVCKDINIDVEIIKYIKDKGYNLNKKEMFYLEKLSKELVNVLNVIKKQEKNSKLNKYLFESELYVYKDTDDVKVTFKGLIDKVMYTKSEDTEVLAVVDYKTGDIVITLDNLKYGLNMQLPIYLFLLKKSDRFKDAEVAGFYIQKVLSKVPDVSDKKTLEEIREEEMRLQGFTNRANQIVELLDDHYLENKILKNLKFKKNGELEASAKVLSNEEMNELTKVVEEVLDKGISNILDANFSINPKVIKDKNVACKYCKFKDICFMTKKDEVMLGGDSDEMDRGTVGCNN